MNDTEPDTSTAIEKTSNEVVRDDHGRVIHGSLNPKGRPKKGHSITETIRSMMDEKPEIKRALGAKVLQMALNGDLVAIRTIWSYMDGMPKFTGELTGTEGGPMEIKIIEDKKNE